MHAISGATRLKSGERCREGRRKAPRFLPVKYRMQMKDQQPRGLRQVIRWRAVPGTLVALCILLAFALTAVGCSKSKDSPISTSPEARDSVLRQIAADYARSGDLSQAQVALDKLALANPAQLIVSLAETDAAAGRPTDEVVPLARLAEALGTRSPKLVAYLEPTAVPSPTAAPPTTTPTSPPSPTPAPTLTATALPPTATTLPPTSSPTLAPQKPRVVAEGDVNLRSGPGRAYPIMGKLLAGKEADILGRNASGDWWRIDWPGQSQAWVAGTVIKVLGAIDAVAVAKDIPSPPSTPIPAPTAIPQPPQPPKVAGPDFRLTEHRLWDVEENGGHLDSTSVNCGDGHLMRVTVLDAAGNRLNGVTVKVIGGGQQEIVTGGQGKGDGIAEFDLYKPGADVHVVRDADGREVTSDTAAGPTMTDAIPFDVLMGARYCANGEDCNHFLSQNGCTGHYSWSATFRRAY
jgi:uncharacterized protein YraI